MLDKIWLRTYSTNTRRVETDSAFAGRIWIGSFIHSRLLSLPLLSELRRAGVFSGLDSDQSI